MQDKSHTLCADSLPILGSQSGRGLDVWGGLDTQASVIPSPGGPEPCTLKVDGECPEGCEACVEFARQMEPSAVSRRDAEHAEDGC